MRNLNLVGAALVASIAVSVTQPVEAQTLRMAYSTDVSTMDPHSVAESNTIGFMNHVYDALVRYNTDFKPEPALATSWEVVDPKRWRFTLRKGVKFHNGSPFTADDAVASIKRVAHPASPLKGDLPTVLDAVKVDDFTLDIVLNSTDPILLNYLTNVMIFDLEWMEEHNSVDPVDARKGEKSFASTNANGTGPFILESRQPDAKTVLVVNPNWWDTPTHNLTRIVFTPISSDATRVAALLSGEIDFMYPSPLQDAERIKSAEGISVLEAPALRTIMLGLDVSSEELRESNIKGANPLKDIRVRKALYTAIDMDLIRKKIMRGKSRNAGLLVAPEVPGFDASINNRFPYDPENSKSLLSKAGYSKGFGVGMDCPNNRYVNDEEICQAIVAMWAKVGVDAHLTAQTKGKHFDKVLGGNSDIYMFGWATLPMLDSFSVIATILSTPNGALGTWNPGGYSNARIDELAQKIGGELDIPTRTRMMTEALKIAKDEVALIPLHQQPLSWAIRDNVKMPQFPDNKPRLWHARKN